MCVSIRFAANVTLSGDMSHAAFIAHCVFLCTTTGFAVRPSVSAGELALGVSGHFENLRSSSSSLTNLSPSETVWKGNTSRETDASGHIPQGAECWDSGWNMKSRDEKCAGDLVCARKGYNDRDFGCEKDHCCSSPPEDAGDDADIDSEVEKKKSKYGFYIGDEVTWEDSDDDVPTGSVGSITGFTEDADGQDVRVEFRKGNWGFNHAELKKVEQFKLKFGFHIGDSVTWVKADEDIPSGSEGVVTGFSKDGVHVLFPSGDWEMKPAHLQKVGGTLTECHDGEVMVANSVGVAVETVEPGLEYLPWVYFTGQWYPICGHYFWNNDNGATTFCHKLGFESGEVIKKQDILLKDALPVGRCKKGSALASCNVWADPEASCGIKNAMPVGSCGPACKAGSKVGVRVKCHAGSGAAGTPFRASSCDETVIHAHPTKEALEDDPESVAQQPWNLLLNNSLTKGMSHEQEFFQDILKMKPLGRLTQMALLAWASYDPLVNGPVPHWKMLLAWDFADNGKDHAVIYQEPNENECALVFSGSDDMGDWVSNFRVGEREFDCGGTVAAEDYLEKVHWGASGGLNTFMTRDIRDGVSYASFTSILSDKKQCSKVAVVGHSRGGSFANMLAACSTRKSFNGGWYTSNVYTFGAPGEAKVALRNHRSESACFGGLRVHNEQGSIQDPVPAISLEFGFVHPLMSRLRLDAQAVVTRCSDRSEKSIEEMEREPSSFRGKHPEGTLHHMLMYSSAIASIESGPGHFQYFREFDT